MEDRVSGGIPKADDGYQCIMNLEEKQLGKAGCSNTNERGIGKRDEKDYKKDRGGNRNSAREKEG